MQTLGPMSDAAGKIPAAGKAAELNAAETNRQREAEEVRDKFTTFFGETFFQQMVKAMRTMTDKPAYFYGGRGEEVFRGQLDQQLAEEMSKAGASQIAEPMFEQAFPTLARMLSESESPHGESLDDLAQVSRRYR